MPRPEPLVPPARGVDAEAAREKAHAAERRLAGFRLLLMGTNTVIYYGLIDKSQAIPWLANVIVAVSYAYGGWFLLFAPYRRFPFLVSGYFSSMMDTALVLSWVYATGGYYSPFHVILYVTVFAVAFRYGWRETVVAAVAQAAGYVLLIFLLGELGAHVAEVSARAAYVLLLALLGGLVSRELFGQTAARIKVEERMRAALDAEARFRTLAQSASDAILSTDDRGVLVYVNAAAEQMFGYATAELQGLSIDRLVPERLRRASWLPGQGVEPALGKSFEQVGTRQDGSEFAMELSFAGWQVGRDRFYTAIVRDLTRRKQAEEQLRRSEAQLAEAQEIARLGSWEWDFPTNRVTWSAELVRVYGSAPPKVGGVLDGMLDLVHPDDRKAVRQAVERAIDEKRPFGIEHRIVRPDGEIRTLQARGRIIVDAGGKPLRMAGTVQDVTERKQLETQIVAADRMTSIGTLAGGVAHEINNPLASVIANLVFVADEMPKLVERSTLAHPPEAHLWALQESLGEARQGAERVRDIVRDLKIFSRTEDDRRSLVDVRRVLDSTVNMAFNEIRHRARLVKDYGDVPPVDANESRLGQVFLNLLVNAAHAIPEGHADTNEIRIVTGTNDGRVIVEVRDTGSGIPRDALGRIFDPFFTTQPIGHGTGLGLSVCHGIVAALGGEITAESEVGKGSVFRVRLPPAPPEPSSRPPASAGSRAPAGRRGRILVVDDDPFVVASMRRVLSTEHDVVTAGSGTEALDRFVAGERFDVILCDLMMPQMTGMDLHAALSEKVPEQAERMIFVTGGAFTVAAHQFLDQVSNHCVEKPFDPQNLKTLIRRLLK